MILKKVSDFTGKLVPGRCSLKSFYLHKMFWHFQKVIYSTQDEIAKCCILAEKPSNNICILIGGGGNLAIFFPSTILTHPGLKAVWGIVSPLHCSEGEKRLKYKVCLGNCDTERIKERKSQLFNILCFPIEKNMGNNTEMSFHFCKAWGWSLLNLCFPS